MIDPAAPFDQVAIAVLAAATIATVAWRVSLLNASGVIATVVLGGGLVAVGGWWIGGIMVAFFLTASLLPSASHPAPVRSWQQVAANGAPALAFSMISALTGSSAWLLGAAATIAAAGSDTWATEIGRTYGGTPISVRTRRPVPSGTSGAVSPAGTIGSILGAITIAIIATALSPIAPERGNSWPAILIIVATSGIVGSLLDTLLGAWLQARFVCTCCGHHSESPEPHQPGHTMALASGLPWMTNSTVNLVATTAAGLFGTVCALL